jgi:hypothetical protein
MFTKAHFGFERLRGEKRFQDLLKKIGLEH